MISASDSFNIALAESSRNFKASICINGSEIDGDIQLVDVFRGTGSESILFGAVYIPYFTAKIANLNTDLQDAEVTLRIGVRLPGGSYDYIPLGNYHIVEIANAQGLCSIKGMGSAFCKLEGKNIPTTGNNSPKTLLQDIRNLANVTILSDFSNERLDRNVRIPIKSRLEPHSCKEVLGIVAALMGGFVTENASGSIVLKEYASGSTISIPADRFLTPPTINNNYYEITGVKCIIHDNPGYESDPDSRSKGTVNYTFRNKYMSEGLFDDMADTAIGLRYYPGQFSISLGDPRIDPWDILSVTDTDGVSRTVYPMQIHHHIDGGLSTEIDAQMSTTGDMGSGTATQTITIGSYDELLGKPSINDVILSGNQTFEDLGLYDDPAFASTVAELTTGKADDDDVVHIAGAETVTGAKTFTQPIVGTVSLTQGIPFGQVDSTSTNTAYTATVDGITELKDGVVMLLKNGVVTSKANFTININGLGAKPVYNSMATGYGTTDPARDSTIFNIAYTMLFIYSEDLVAGGCWICYRGYNSDTNTLAYMIRNYQATLVMKSVLYRYMFVFTTPDGLAVPSCGVRNSTAVNKTLTTEEIDPFGPIYYYAYTTDVEANSSPSASYMYTMRYDCNMRYGFNVSSTALTAKESVYVRCVPQGNGSVKLDGNDCIVQSLPSSADGKVYIYLGRAYSAYQIDMPITHPVYYYSGGRIREWTGADSPMIFYDTTENWNAQATLVGQPGSMYVYTDVDKVKIGDGQAYLIDNPFISDFIDEVDDHINDTDIHITAAERLFWNNKVRCYYDLVNRETLVFTTS